MTNHHEANRAMWDAQSRAWEAYADERGTWRKAHLNPALVLSQDELALLGDLQDKDVCVLGSGDNEVAFALAGMGAKVTSVDISQQQIEIAKRRAAVLGLSLSFLRSDVMDLESIADASCDVVYTGGHVSIWLSDIQRCYREAARILRSDGLFIVNEYHPVRRVWLESTGGEPRYRYFDRGPFKDHSDEGLPAYEYHWTVSDHIQAVVDAGCALVNIAEHGDGREDESYLAHVPAELPRYLLLVGQKRHVQGVAAAARRQALPRSGKLGDGDDHR